MEILNILPLVRGLRVAPQCIYGPIWTPYLKMNGFRDALVPMVFRFSIHILTYMPKESRPVGHLVGAPSPYFSIYMAYDDHFD